VFLSLFYPPWVFKKEGFFGVYDKNPGGGGGENRSTEH